MEVDLKLKTNRNRNVKVYNASKNTQYTKFYVMQSTYTISITFSKQARIS